MRNAARERSNTCRVMMYIHAPKPDVAGLDATKYE